MSESSFRAILILFGIYQIAQALWMMVSPGSFFDAIAGFGVQNDHYIRDNATFSLAIGVGFLLAVGRPSWRLSGRPHRLRGPARRLGGARLPDRRRRARRRLRRGSPMTASAGEVLLDELRAHALVIGEVTLTSGQTASYYVDAKGALLGPRPFGPTGELVAAAAAELSSPVARKARGRSS